MLNYYKVKVRVIESKFNDEVMAAYNFETHTIEFNTKNIKQPRDFIFTLLHEINHAIVATHIGKTNFRNKYMLESNILDRHQKDPYWDNKYEIQAEEFARKNYKQWSKYRPI